MCCRTRIRTATFCLNDLVLPLHHTAYIRMGGTQVNVLFTADLQPPCGFLFLYSYFIYKRFAVCLLLGANWLLYASARFACRLCLCHRLALTS